MEANTWLLIFSIVGIGGISLLGLKICSDMRNEERELLNRHKQRNNGV